MGAFQRAAAGLLVAATFLVAGASMTSAQGIEEIVETIDQRVGDVRPDRLAWEWTAMTPYGTSYGQEGTVYHSVGITLENRDSNWYQGIEPIDGPAINGRNRWNCVDDNGWQSNTSCSGGSRSEWAGAYQFHMHVSTAGYHHSDNAKYWYDFNWEWRNSSWETSITWSTSTFSSREFTCTNNTPPCRFPAPDNT